MRQWIFDTFMSQTAGGVIGRTWRMAYHLTGTVLGGNVVYRYKDMDLTMPLKHQFPVMEKYDPEQSKSIGRVARIVSDKYPDSVFFDIGANVGDTAAIMRTYAPNTIYAVEGVDYFYRLLEKNAASIAAIHPVKAYISYDNQDRDVQLKVMASGNAVVYPDNDLFGTDTQGSTNERIETTTLEQLVKKLGITKPVKFLKTDIEGLDLPVLNASIDFIAANKPVLYFECHVCNAFDTSYGVTFIDFASSLRQIGYVAMLYWDNSREFQHAIALDDTALLMDFDALYRNRNGFRYADVCMVHADDADIAQSIRISEREHFVSQRPTTWWGA
jgi:FkbM family methyltransferase